MSKTNHGYIAVGKDKDRAVANYRSAMMGKNIVCLASETDSYVTPDDLHTMFNPATGELDLQTQDISQQSLNFVSENSEDFGDAFWVVCADGCGSHIVYEKDGAVKFCPVCSSELSEPSAEDAETAEVDEDEGTGNDAEDTAETETTEDETSVESDSKTSCSGEEGETTETSTDVPAEKTEGNEEGETSDTTENETSTDEDTEDDAEDDADETEDSSDDEDDTDGEESDETEASFSGVVVSSTSYEKARKLYANAVVGKAARAVVSESGNRAYITSTSETLSFDPVDGESLLNSVADFTLSEAETQSLSTSEAHYMVCSSEDGCGNHVVSSVEISNCPVCSNKLQEPVVASDEEDEGETEEQVDEVQEEPTDSITMNLLDDATDDSQLSVAFSRNFVNGKDAWLASLNGQPVGFATRDDVGGNADIFDKEAFGKAVIAQSKDGSKVALKEFGFKPFVITASVKQKVAEQVEQQVAVAKQELVAESKAQQERFMAALSISAVGINKGFFSGVDNPLKSKLWESMSTAGIQNPEVLIDNIFSTSSDVYHKVLLDKAAEILSMSTDVQNELAKTVLGTAYQKVSTSSAAPVQQQVGTLGTPVKSVSTSQSAVPSNGIAAKIQSLKFAKR